MKNKHIDIIKSMCLILAVLELVFSTVCYVKNGILLNIIEFLKVLIYPVILFLLGYLIHRNDYDDKELNKRTILSLIVGLFINIFCYSIIYLIKGNSILLLESLFKGNIFIFISLMYLFFKFIRKYEFEVRTLWGIGLLCSVINTLIIVKGSFESNVIIESLVSIICSVSNYSSFSFLAWVIIPISGYLYSDLSEYKDTIFYVKSAMLCLLAYIFLFRYSKVANMGYYLIDYRNSLSFYKMNIYNGIANVCLCVFIYSFIYLLSRYISKKIYRHVKRWSKNIILIYLISMLITNYVFLLVFNGMATTNIIESILLSAIVFIISDVLSRFINKSK